MAELSITQFLSRGIVQPFEAGVLETIRTTDQLVAFLPWLPIQGDTYRYLREKALPGFGWLAPAATLTPDNAAQNAEVTAYLRSCGGDMTFNNLQGQAGGGSSTVLAKGTAAGAKALARLIGNAVINGNSTFTYTLDSTATTIANTVTGVVPGPNHDTRFPNGAIRYTHVGTSWAYRAPGDSVFGDEVVVAPSTTGRLYSGNPDLYVDITRNANAIGADATGALVLSGGTAQFDGLIALSPTSQQVTTATNGENLTFTLLDKLIQLNKDTGSQKVLILSERTFISFQALMRTAGGVTMGELQGAPVATYGNIPVLQSGWIPTNQTKGICATATSAWCVSLGSENGLAGIYNTAAPNDAPPPNARLLGQSMPGIQVWDLGLGATSDSRQMRCTAYVGLVNKLTLGLSWANGILD